MDILDKPKKLNPFNIQNSHAPFSKDTAVFWFRRDLRLADNAGLYHALKDNKFVLPLFIFDTKILQRIECKEDRRIEFIYQTLQHLKSQLQESGSSLVVLVGDPVELFSEVAAKSVYTNHDYEPYARQRDASVENTLRARGISFKTFKDQVIFERDEVVKGDGTPYSVFTPYSRRWKSLLTKFHIRSYSTETYLKNLKKCTPLVFPSMSDIGFKQTGASFPDRFIKNSIIDQYDKHRNFPALSTTRLSVHLRFGTVSIRKLARLAVKRNQVWLNELIWRDFYHMILWHFPHVEKKAFKSAYDRIAWRNDPKEFAAWCDGKTGYPIVDAGMRELNATGFMHNRVRMITASFLTKHLLTDWRWGEAYFASKLLDFDLAANNGGWQWAAGSGCDAAPYFRIFNPQLQAEKFDPKQEYVLRWVPEVATEKYPSPIVNHKAARDRALRAYKAVLG